MRELRTIFLSAIVICCAVSVNAATFVVDNNADTDNLAVYTGGDGTNTLRKCIRLANTTPGADVINFNLPGSTIITSTTCGGGWWHLITETVTIDGYTQPGSGAGNPLVELNGCAGLWGLIRIENATANGTTVRGLVMYNSNIGISTLNSDNHIFSGNYIGVNQAGTGIAGNPIREHGIFLENSVNSLIGGLGGQIDRNIISGCNQQGIRLINADDTDILGNYVGTDVTGLADLGSVNFAIYAESSSGLTIGGTAVNSGNILSGTNNNDGIFLTNACDNAVILGNIIGLGADLTTQLGNRDGIEVNNSDGLIIGDGTLAGRNYISSNLQMGIRVANTDNISIIGNYIGVDGTGMVDRGNSESGIRVENNTNVTIQFNIVSGNNQSGIFLVNASPSTIQGNIVGMGIDGTTVVANNTFGINLETNCHNAQIGGTTITERNLVSGNGQAGIRVINSDTIVVEGNYVGVDVTGMLDRGNATQGVNFENSDSLRIGGNTIASRNIISGNNQQGIRAINTTTVVIKANIIGLDADSSAALPNNQGGVIVENGTRLIVGGSNITERNFISGNGETGLRGTNISISTLIQGNYIGVDGTGLLDRGNSQYGVFLLIAPNTVIGGTGAGERNIISGNGQDAIHMENASHNPVILGNILGLGLDMSTIIDNREGIEIRDSDNAIVGDGTLAGRNYISGNIEKGIRGYRADNIVIKGNYIGLGIAGNVDKGNGQGGIFLEQTETPIIGGGILGEGNMICGNNQTGMEITGDECHDALVQGNIFGLAATDTSTIIQNTNTNILIRQCENTQIGGTLVTERNYISAAGAHGISLQQGCDNSVIEGNYVGVDVTGLLDRGNNNEGIEIQSSQNVTVGGTTYAARNIICASGGNGILVGGTSKNAVIKANFVGVGLDGATPLGNLANGILIDGSSDSATVGGPNAIERNIFSDNGQFTVNPPDPDAGFVGDGIRVFNTVGHMIEGNYLGTDSTGTIGLGNHWAGVSFNGVDSCVIRDNLICDNRNEGIWLQESDSNLIIRNQIGLATDGSPLGNWDWGIVFDNSFGSSDYNTVGGSPGNGNIITGTRGERPTVAPGAQMAVGQFNEITFNSIYCNAGIGINLEGVANESVPAPVIDFSNPDDLQGTGVAGNTIHVYLNATDDGSGWCDCEGEIYIGTTTVAGDGTWMLTHNLGLNTTQSESATATQTTPNGSTSEFSNCNAPLPVTYLSFKAEKITNSEVLLTWATIDEIDNDYFIVQRSTDGVNFEDIGQVDGSGVTNNTTYYSFTDYEPGSGMVYYRLQQVDFDANYSFSEVRSVLLGNGSNISVNQTGATVDIITSFEGDVKITISLVNLKGQVLMQDVYTTSGTTIKSLRLEDLPSGVYILQLQGGGQMVTEKLVF